MDLNHDCASNSIDIQDVFDSLVLVEDDCAKIGFEEGIKAGEVSGYQEGFDLGFVKGKEIGSEIAFYKGFAKGWIAVIHSPTELKELVNQTVERYKPSLPSEIPARVQVILEKIKDFPSTQGDSKVLKHLEKLLQLAGNFPQENLKDESFQQNLSALRAKFKLCCALLKVETDSNPRNQLSF